MRKKDYFPQALLSQRAFFELQVVQWPLHGPTLGYTPVQVTGKVTGCQAQLDAINSVMQQQAEVAKAVERRNLDSDAFAAVYRLDVRRDKLRPGVNPAIFTAFGWEGDQFARPDLDTVQPQLTHVQVLPGPEVHLDFIRKIFDGVDAEYSATGAGDWTKGDFDTRSPYEDKRPLRVPGQPETRYYRFRYRYQGAPVGQYSDVVRAVVPAD